MKIGIIGHGQEKFTPEAEAACRAVIKDLLEDIMIIGYDPIVVSGHSPVGGVDIYAEQIADELGLEKDIKAPRQHKWDSEYGYKKRNLDIAKSSDKLYIFVVDKYPPNYDGMVFKGCYHCHRTDHIKSGACWTGLQAEKLGKIVEWVLIHN